MVRGLMVLAAFAALVAQPAAAQDRTGFRLESRASLETPVFSGEPTDGETYALGNGLTLGFEGGYDVQLMRRLTVGPYVNYERSDLQNCDGSNCVSSQDTAAGGLHIAYLRGERTLYYAKLGYARLALAAQVHGQDLADTGGGMQAALGYEHALSNSLYLRIEAGYADHGRIFAVDFERYHSTAAVGWRF